MLSFLPDLTPRDSHSLWYTSSRNPHRIPPHLDPSLSYHHPGHGTGLSAGAGSAQPSGHSQAGGAQQRARAHHRHHHAGGGSGSSIAVERSTLARLRADETYMERRRLNVSNFGATWLKPPGVGKSLFQMREERREQEEHAEAMRREQLAQELAEAEAAGAAAAAAAAGGLNRTGAGMGGDMGAMDGVVDLDVDLDPMDEDLAGGGDRDLDDDIPDADDGMFGLDADSDDDDENEEDEEDEDDDDDENDGDGGADGSQHRRAQRRELASRMATVRAAEDRAREQVLRGQGAAAGSDIYDGEEELDDEDQAQMLEEEDLVEVSSRVLRNVGVEPGTDMDMDANLDDDIPEAESDGYEHTDTEAELSSSSDDGGAQDTSFAAAAVAARGPQASRFRTSLAHSDATRTSIDISSVLSRDGSSFLGSSPQTRRAH